MTDPTPYTDPWFDHWERAAGAERKVVDLMAALEQSVNDAKAARRRKLDEATPDTEGEG